MKQAILDVAKQDGKTLDDIVATNAANTFVAVQVSNVAAGKIDNGLDTLFASADVSELLKQLKESKKSMAALQDPKTQEELKQLTEGVGA